jgi:hypothetical protein
MFPFFQRDDTLSVSEMINSLCVAMVLVVCRRTQDNLLQSFGSLHLLVSWLQLQIVTPTLEIMHYEIWILLAK